MLESDLPEQPLWLARGGYIIVNQDLCERLRDKKWKKFHIQKMRVLDEPLDGLPADLSKLTEEDIQQSKKKAAVLKRAKTLASEKVKKQKKKPIKARKRQDQTVKAARLSLASFEKLINAPAPGFECFDSDDPNEELRFLARVRHRRERTIPMRNFGSLPGCGTDGKRGRESFFLTDGAGR